MARVLVTGGAGTIGSAVVRRLIRDADWEVRVSARAEVPEPRAARDQRDQRGDHEQPPERELREDGVRGQDLYAR